tara:strand:- start:36746 stop:38617 length:1872 start_codon:yes stop_codon:yes gene_type:complete
MSAQGPKKPAEYCFAQQKDSSCHVMPFINLQILNNMRAGTGGELNLSEGKDWYTKREWFPQTFKWTKNWQQAMAQLRTQEGPFYEMQKRQMENGLINGHFYTADGKRVDDTWNPITNYANMMLYPFNFTDATTMPNDLAWEHYHEAFKTLPLIFDNGKAKCYDDSIHDYVELEEVGIDGDWDVALAIIPGVTNSETMPSQTLGSSNQQEDAGDAALNVSKTMTKPFGWGTQRLKNLKEKVTGLGIALWESAAELFDSAYEKSFPASADKGSKNDHDAQQYDLQLNKPQPTTATHRFFKLSPTQKKLLELPDKAILDFYNPSTLGFDVAYKYRYLPVESQTQSYYMSSLCQLILFGMGVDKNNNIITEGHDDYAAHQEFTQAMASAPNNPWQLDSFKKENFLEYHLANMIKTDPKLKKQMEDNVSIFFPTWEKYKEIDSLYDEAGQPLTGKSKELMGEEQYLAYCYTQSARFLWAASTSRQAFNAVLELDPTLARLLRLPGTPGPNQVMRNAATKINGHSFLDTWSNIQQQLRDDPTVPNELASFSGHGMVMSFNKDLMKAQSDAGLNNPGIISTLGFSVIDSYYGEQLSPMYRRENTGQTNDIACDIAALSGQEQASAHAKLK